MKKWILSAVVLFAANAFAQNFNPVHTLQGPRFEIVKAEDLIGDSIEAITGGSLVITQNQVELIAFVNVVCPPGHMCAMYMPAPIHVRLPILHRQPSGCGDRILAGVDARPTDGALQRLEIVDYSRATCKMLLPAPMTAQFSVMYFDRLQGKMVEKKTRLLLNRQH